MANWQRGVLRVMGVANHPVTVTSVTDFTPWYRRIRFSSPEFVAGLEVFPTLWLRLWVPNLAKGEGKISQRGYTLRHVDPAAGTFDLEFVLHETKGPAGDWAREAQVGQTVEVSITPARPKVTDGVSRFILAGDVTALPALATWVDAVDPQAEVHVFVEDPHPDTAALPRGNREVPWTWVQPGATRGAALAEALATEPVGNGYGWAAGERQLVKQVRAAWKGQGLDKSQFFSQNYWIEGRSAG